VSREFTSIFLQRGLYSAVIFNSMRMGSCSLNGGNKMWQEFSSTSYINGTAFQKLKIYYCINFESYPSSNLSQTLHLYKKKNYTKWKPGQNSACTVKNQFGTNSQNKGVFEVYFEILLKITFTLVYGNGRLAPIIRCLIESTTRDTRFIDLYSSTFLNVYF